MSEIPKKIGRFPILHTLGVGGMGMVYSAKDPDIGRLVAIKVLHSNGDNEALERFKNEARTIGEISHPNIVMLLEYGVDDKKPFLVMEYLAGESLEKWIKTSHQLIEHKNVLLDLCAALNFAHSKDILHRDLKPGNLQILPTGQAKLLDFGIARSDDTGLTATGFFIGTPQFLAPEILESTNHSKSSDCYSLGLIAYTMLSGINPFSAKSFEATMTRQLTFTPPLLHELNSNIPIELSTVIASYLDKNPDTRTQSPELLENALRQITTGAQLNKIIVPQKEIVTGSSTTTKVFSSNQSTNKLNLFIVILITIILVISIAIYYMNKEQDQPLPNQNKSKKNSAIITQEKPIDNKTDSDKIDLNKKEITKDETIIDKTETIKNDLNKTNNSINEKTDKSEESSSIIDESIKSDVKPVKKNEDKANSKPTETHTTTVKKPETKTKQPINKKTIQEGTHQASEVDSSKINVNMEEDKRINSTSQITPSVASSTDNKTTEKTIEDKKPVFTLPELNHNSNKVKLKAVTSTNLSRGKTKTITIELLDSMTMDKFAVYRGRAEFPQIKILHFKKIRNNRIELKIYAESNTPLGDYTLYGIYNKKKTSPITIKVTL